ncbi:MAG: hypothetical protein ACREET_16360 [Stellaceae bacterium]
MRALATAIIYFGSFLALGLVAKRVIGRRMSRSLELPEIQAQAGPNRRRRVFLLGFWRDEGPD